MLNDAQKTPIPSAGCNNSLIKKSQTPGLALNPRAVESSSAQLHLVAAVANPDLLLCISVVRSSGNQFFEAL